MLTSILAFTLAAALGAPSVPASDAPGRPGAGPLAFGPLDPGGLDFGPSEARGGRDTLVQVDPGTRVVIQTHEGTIVVRAWDRNAVEVISDEEESRIRLDRSSGSLAIQPGGRWGEPVHADLTVRVPAGSPLKVHAPFADVEIEGVTAEVSVETVEGDIRLAGGSGIVTLHTVEGDIEASGVSGRMEVNTMDGDIRLTSVSGDLTVNTVDGDVRLRDVASSNVKATTVDGDVLYDGELRPSGSYRLSTHDGDLFVTVPERSGAIVSVATWAGEFSASFPIEWEGRREGKRMEFTIGDGGARLELQSFDGEIRLIRPGESPPERE